MPYEKIGEGEPVCIADEVPFEIPESWEWVRLSFLGEIVGGGTPKTSDRESWANATIPWLTPADMKYVTGKYVSHGERAISEYGLAHSSAQLMPAGSILYSSRAPIGYIAISGNSICTNQGFKSLVPVIPDLNDYLYYCLITLTPSIQARASGTTFKEISRTEFGKTLIPIPPLKEQKRIVTKIEDAMPGVEQYSERANTLTRLNHDFPDSLKKSILQWAVQGKLVPQDPNDEPASVLLERIRAEKGHLIRKGKIKRDKHESVIFRRDNSYYEVSGKIETCIDDEVPFDIPESWVWCRLSSIVSILGDGIHGTPQYSLDGEVAFINGNNLSDGKIIIRASTKTVSANEAEKHKRELNDSTVLVSINGTIGNIAFYEGEHVILGKSACFFNLLPGINKEYIKIVLETYYFSKYVSQVATGTTIKNVPLAGMREFLVPIPPEMEQLRIIERSKIAIEQITNFLL